MAMHEQAATQFLFYRRKLSASSLDISPWIGRGNGAQAGRLPLRGRSPPRSCRGSRRHVGEAFAHPCLFVKSFLTFPRVEIVVSPKARAARLASAVRAVRRCTRHKDRPAGREPLAVPVHDRDNGEQQRVGGQRSDRAGLDRVGKRVSSAWAATSSLRAVPDPKQLVHPVPRKALRSGVRKAEYRSE